MAELPKYQDIFEGEDDFVFGAPETIDQEVDWVDLVVNGEDATGSAETIWYLEGLNGDDTIYADGIDSGVLAIFGGAGNDTIYGGGAGSRHTTIFGGDGDDFILAEGKVILNVYGGAGNDEIHVRDGWAYGGEGDDEIQVRGGRAYGGIGDDTLYSNGERTVMEGGTGNDTLFLNGDYERIVYNPLDGTDTVHGFHSSPGAVIDVSGFGFASVASLLSYASVHGDDVRINFGGSNEIVLVDFHAHGGTLDTSDFLV